MKKKVSLKLIPLAIICCVLWGCGRQPDSPTQKEKGLAKTVQGPASGISNTTNDEMNQVIPKAETKTPVSQELSNGSATTQYTQPDPTAATLIEKNGTNTVQIPQEFREKKYTIHDKPPKETRQILRTLFRSFDPNRTREEIIAESIERIKQTEQTTTPQSKGLLNMDESRLAWYNEGVLFDKSKQKYTSECDAFIDPSPYAEHQLWFRERLFENDLINLRLQAEINYDPEKDIYSGPSETTDHYFVVHTDGYGDIKHIFYYDTEDAYLQNTDHYLYRCDGLLPGEYIQPVGFSDSPEFWRDFIKNEKWEDVRIQQWKLYATLSSLSLWNLVPSETANLWSNWWDYIETSQLDIKDIAREISLNSDEELCQRYKEIEEPDNCFN